ncbi:MAG: hypothetical protein ACRC18_06670 [Cetobacterium sp.]
MERLVVNVEVDCLECVSNIFNNLANTSGRLDKEKILKDNSDNELFKECLRFLLDTYTTTGISKTKLNKKLNKSLNKSRCDNIVELMDYIKRNNTGRDIDIILVQKFIDDNQLLRDFIFGLMTKSLKVGVSKKTANSVYGDSFVDDFKVMRSTNYEDCKNKFDKDALKHGYAIYLKENGVRGEIIVENSSVKIRSRQGLYVYGLIEIEEAFKDFPNGLYEGEFIAIGDFEDSNERCRKTRSIYSKNGIKRGLKIALFDYVSLDDMIRCKNSVPAKDRKEFVKNIVDKHKSEFITYIEPLYEGKDLSMMDKLLNEVTDMKEEGISCNILTAPYEFKKTYVAAKYKRFNTIDLKVIGMLEGDGKHKGRLGSMLVDYKGNPVGVGGWTDEEREYYWNNQDEYIGRVLEISYKDITTDTKTGKLSLEFAQRVTMRELGKEVSYS